MLECRASFWGRVQDRALETGAASGAQVPACILERYADIWKQVPARIPETDNTGLMEPDRSGILQIDAFL